MKIGYARASTKDQSLSMQVDALYKNGSIPVKKIAEQFAISKTTLDLYLRHRNVDIGAKSNEPSNKEVTL